MASYQKKTLDEVIVYFEQQTSRFSHLDQEVYDALAYLKDIKDMHRINGNLWELVGVLGRALDKQTLEKTMKDIERNQTAKQARQ